MTNKTPRVTKNRRESTTPGTRKPGKLFFFLLLLLSFFRRASSASPQSLMMVFARNSSILHRAVHQPIALSQPPSNLPSALRALWKTMASLFERHFVTYLCACSQNGHVATKQLSVELPQRLRVRVDVLCQQFVASLPSYPYCVAAVLTATTSCFTR